MSEKCACGCGARVTYEGMFRKDCALRLGTTCNPNGVKKAANAKSNPINNPIRERKRKDKLTASEAELGLEKIVRYSDGYLRSDRVPPYF